MTTVERVRVGDVLRLERIPVESDPLREYTTIGIRSFGRGLFHYEPAAGDKLGSLRFFALKPERLVISNIKGWEGAVAVSSEDESGCIASNRFLTYDSADGQIDVNWARWYFLSEPGNDLIQRASPGSADRNRTLAVKRFENLVIPLPPIEQQRKVAARLDNARATTDRASHLAARSATLAAALRASITLRDGDSRKWPRVPLRRVLTLDLRQTPVVATRSYDIAGVYSFGRGLFERGPTHGSQTSYKTLHELQAGQLVMSRLKGWEGALATVEDRLAGWFVSPEFPTFTSDAALVNPRFLDAVVTSEPFWSALADSSKGVGARRERVHAQRLLEQVISLPPIGEQDTMVRLIQLVDVVRAMRPKTDERMRAMVPAHLNNEFGALS